MAFLGPIFLVRLLSVEQFGEFRDFLLYATVLFTLVEFCINGSIAYFVPKDPSRENHYFTQASMFVLFTSLAAALFVLVFGDHFPSLVIREYKYALCLYVLFLCNLDAWEVLWITKKQAINVLFYSLTRLTVRTAAVVLAAFLTREVSDVIWTLVVVEGIRLLVMGRYAVRKRLFTAEISTASMKAQFAFFGPIGAGNMLHTANIYMGQIYISAVMGPAMLALYAIGAYLYPIIHVFQSSVGETIMPEIASKTDQPPKVALVLWQRATIVYCAVMMPIALLLFYYADVFVSLLFTSAFTDATPIFQIFVFLLIRECFDFSLPLRIVHRTNVFLKVSTLTLIINLGLMLLLVKYYGLLGPALAIVITRFVGGIYLGGYVMKYCEFSFGELLPWTDIAKTVVLCLGCATVLFAGELFDIGSLIRAVLFGGIYLILFGMILSKSGISEVNKFVLRIRERVGLGA